MRTAFSEGLPGDDTSPPTLGTEGIMDGFAGGPTAEPKVCLTIGSSDSSGGAGIQGDIKALASIGCHAATALVGITAQNTRGVVSRHTVPVPAVRAQIDAVLDDLAVDAVKVGTLWSAELVADLAARLADLAVPLVADPVMVTAAGSRLYSDDAVEAFVAELLPLAAVITPNLPEARLLARRPDEDDPVRLCAELVRLGASAVVITGGGREVVCDWLFDGHRDYRFRSTPSSAAATHGAGCAHSALITGLLARGDSVVEAVSRAGELAAEGVGRGLVGIGSGESPVDLLDLRRRADALSRPRRPIHRSRPTDRRGHIAEGT